MTARKRREAERGLARLQICKALNPYIEGTHQMRNPTVREAQLALAEFRAIDLLGVCWTWGLDVEIGDDYVDTLVRARLSGDI